MQADALDWARSPGHGRYARPERERRFLLAAAAPDAEQRLITDRYLDGLRLRLREVRVGEQRTFKLTQKIRLDPSDPAQLSITNLYLSADEHQRLSALPGATLVKLRRLCSHEGFLFAVDELQGRHAGLRLAEVELDDLGADLPLPPWVGREVTHDDRFSGGRLAAADDAQVAALLAES